MKISVIYDVHKFKASDNESIFYTHLRNTIASTYPKSYTLKMFSPNFNDTGAFRAMGVPLFSTIPVKIDVKFLKTIHKYNERIPKYILNQGKYIYVEFLEKCLLQE